MPRKPSKTQVCFRIPIETLDAVRVEANNTGKPMSEVLRSLWKLRCKVKALDSNQRLAVVELKNGHRRVIELVDIDIDT